MNIKKALEDNGFTVKYHKNGNYWEFSQYTPACEDWSLTFYPLSDVKIYAESYDPSDDFKELFEAGQHGFGGVPDVPELWKDQLWKQSILNDVLEELK